MEKIRYTSRVNLAEAAAFRLVRLYCPWAALEDLISWRNELLIDDLGQLLPLRCRISLDFWIKNDKQRRVRISLAISLPHWSSGTADPQLEEEGHWIHYWFDDIHLPVARFSYVNGEFIEREYCEPKVQLFAR